MISLLLPKEISPLWFDHPSTIHGVAHTYRVMFWTQILSENLLARPFSKWYSAIPTLEIQQASLLAYMAAIIHDLSRTHDGICFSHGRRAAENKRWVLEELFGKAADEDWEPIARAVKLHCTHDNPLLPSLEDLVLAILKDADALDRVRIGEKPHPSYIRFPITEQYINKANDFFYQTDDIPADEITWAGFCSIGNKIIAFQSI